jgi:hypothetical protein
MDKMSLSEYIKGFEDEIDSLRKQVSELQKLNESLVNLIGKEMRRTDTNMFELPEKMIFKMDENGDCDPSLNGFT